MDTQTKRFDVNQLLQLGQEQIAVSQMLKGTFDDEIARVNAARAELETRQGIVKTVEEANEQMKIAKMNAAAASTMLSDAQEKADGINQTAADRMRQATEALTALDQARAKLSADISTFKAEHDVEVQKLVQQESALTVRENNLADAEQALKKAQTKLASDIVAFNKRLDALRV